MRFLSDFKFEYIVSRKDHINHRLNDPFSKQLRYIGKSSNGISRPKAHLRPKNYNGKQAHTYLYNWVRYVISKGSLPIIKVIEICSKNNLSNREIFWIDLARRNKCLLTNYTKGGEDIAGPMKGKKHSKETKKEIAESLKGNPPTTSKETYKDPKIREKMRNAKKPFMKSVRCLETNKIFESKHKVSREMNIPISTLCAHLDGKLKHARNYTFKLV